MGTQYSMMKVLIITSAMLALAASDSCSDCTAVTSYIASGLTTPESLTAQGEILVGELCPGSPDPDGCVSTLPGLWTQIAAVLWPGYFDPTAEWMCAGICAAPQDTTMTCNDCKMGIQIAFEQLLSEAVMDAIVEGFTPAICQDTPTDECFDAVDGIIRYGVPIIVTVLAEYGEPVEQVLLLTIGDVSRGPDSGWKMALESLTCNNAVPGTCPARKLR